MNSDASLSLSLSLSLAHRSSLYPEQSTDTTLRLGNIVPNFSAGVPLLLSLIQQAVAAMPDEWSVEIVEAHHDQKVDAPSGTAKRMQRAVAEAGGPTDPATHAVRLGDTIGEHTIWLAGPGERLELKHVATRREVFAIGALRWASWLIKQPAGLYRP